MSDAAGPIDEYIARFPAATQRALQEVRGAIREAAPDAVETLSYGVPTFDLDGRHLVHFGGYARHVGFYSGAPDAADVFGDELSRYKRGKGSVQFPLGEPMPTNLIRRIVAVRVSAVRDERK